MQIRGSHADSKALINPAVYGTAEAVPFVQSSLAGQRVVWTESFPQGLKPSFIPGDYGRAEARPLQTKEFFRSL
jgi:hypothetical protein